MWGNLKYFSDVHILRILSERLDRRHGDECPTYVLPLAPTEIPDFSLLEKSPLYPMQLTSGLVQVLSWEILSNLRRG